METGRGRGGREIGTNGMHVQYCSPSVLIERATQEKQQKTYERDEWRGIRV